MQLLSNAAEENQERLIAMLRQGHLRPALCHLPVANDAKQPRFTLLPEMDGAGTSRQT
jgi:hypothetical protein